MERKHFDIAVIGAGPGGYVAAIKASQKSSSVCLIDKGLFGGSCLNVGCIPTKTLLSSAHVLNQVRHAKDFGISVGSISLDYQKMKERKDQVIEKIRKSLEGLIAANKIEIVRGAAEFTSSKELKVKGEHNLLITANNIIVATGSLPLDIPAFPCDHQKIFNSSSILDITQLPQSIAIIGGGYIGCEFASLFADLGVKVTILEALPSLVMTQGKTVAEALTRAFTKKGIEIHTGVAVEGIDREASNLKVRLKEQSPISCDMALVAIGRKIHTEGLQLEKTGIALDAKGSIIVDDQMQTTVPGIYAIGDVTGKYMLAHVASHQGIVAALNATGSFAKMHYDAVPAVIFTDPEIATVGLSLEQAQEKGFDATPGKFPFQALGKSIAAMETEGFAQIVIDRSNGRILGAQVVGAHASTLIAEIALAMQNELTVDCIIDTIHAHPTAAESWLEAALLAYGTPIHFPPKPKT